MSNTQMKILIVDDEPDMCWALQHLLENLKIQSTTAFSGVQALTLMASNAFRLAFVDAKLPDMEGLELAEKLRNLDPEINIIMVSGYFYRDDAAIKNALKERIINGFVSKPFLHHEICEIAQNLEHTITCSGME